MIIGILRETADKRVAITPDNIKRSKLKDVSWWIQSGAGKEAGFEDQRYAGLGYHKRQRSTILKEADVIVTIFSPADEDLAQIKEGTILISQFRPYQDSGIIEKLKQYPIRVISMDMIPRTTLAQSMDVLSSMASIAGYRGSAIGGTKASALFPNDDHFCREAFVRQKRLSSVPEWLVCRR